MALALAVMNQGGNNGWQAWAFAASLLLGAGRSASLITAALSRRVPERSAFPREGLSRLARGAFVFVIATPVGYVVLVASGAARVPLLFAAALLGAASFIHAIVIGARIYSGARAAESARRVP